MKFIGHDFKAPWLSGLDFKKIQIDSYKNKLVKTLKTK